MLVRRTAALVAALSIVAPVAFAQPKEKAPPDPAKVYDRMVKKVANMIGDERAYTLASAYKLQLLNVLWEDTGRWEGSSVGPNISDVTIEVEGYSQGKTQRSYLMPVMRHDNYTDKTADVKMDKILIPVGNAKKNGQLELVSLSELLRDPVKYMTGEAKGKIKGGSLWAKRDTHALVSAQHAFLPVPKEGQAKFWPVIFNYQSSKKNPAVLTILVTRQGTSITIIDNNRDTIGGDSWGQRLYFNSGGERAPLIAERLADVKASGVTANGENAQDLNEDANVLMLIQVPLKYREPPRRAPMMPYGGDYDMPTTAKSAEAAPAASGGGGSGRARDVSDVDTAVLGHGASEGPYTELDGLTISRDTRFPVRVTLQFYQATSNGVISKDNVKAMAQQIRKVYGKGDFVGSLVVPSGMDRLRPTNWTGVSTAPFVTWRDFPGLVERFASNLMMRPRVSVGVL
ncbi:MAG: hypothetical protein H0T46_18535 [Deltaproteobacteria bacterium]|nr:hypothetical protein [Deltaproteobacteria bacterium]